MIKKKVLTKEDLFNELKEYAIDLFRKSEKYNFWGIDFDSEEHKIVLDSYYDEVRSILEISINEINPQIRSIKDEDTTTIILLSINKPPNTNTKQSKKEDK